MKNYSFICDYAFIGNNGKIGAVGIFERIKKDFLIPSWYLVINFNYDFTNIANLKIKLLKNNIVIEENFTGKELSMNANAFVNKNKAIIIQLQPKSFSELGEYSINTYANDNLIGEARFQVVDSI